MGILCSRWSQAQPGNTCKASAGVTLAKVIIRPNPTPSGWGNVLCLAQWEAFQSHVTKHVDVELNSGGEVKECHSNQMYHIE